MRDGRGMWGTGSAVHNIIQVRDQFVDRRFWNQRGIYGEFAVKGPQLSVIESIFNDLPDTGLRTAFDDFFSRMRSLTRDAHDSTFRLDVLRAGETLTNMVRSNAQALRNQQQDINSEVRAVVTEINSIGQQIAILSEQIHKSEFHGSHANDLRDQRALLIDRLSEFANVSVTERDFSHISGLPNDRRTFVSINGYDFVNHDRLHALELVPRTPAQRRNAMDADGLYDIRFANGSDFNIYSPHLRGTLRGLIDVRDGNAGTTTKVRVLLGNVDLGDPGTFPFGFTLTELQALLPPGADPNNTATWPTYVNIHPWELPQAAQDDLALIPLNRPPWVSTNTFRGIPFYLERMNQMIQTFARAINEGVDHQGDPIPNIHPGGHRAGYGLDGQSGRDFFMWTTDPSGTVDPTDTVAPDIRYLNVFNFDISRYLMRHPQHLGAATSPTSGESDNYVIRGFVAIGDFQSLFREGRLEDFIIATAGMLAQDIQQARRFRANYHEMTVATQNHRLSVSGVDENEELMNMTRFTQLYNVNARMIAAMNEVYDTLINRLGIG
jgi:flagellar hook-associated protein 1 FlgK